MELTFEQIRRLWDEVSSEDIVTLEEDNSTLKIVIHDRNEATTNNDLIFEMDENGEDL